MHYALFLKNSIRFYLFLTGPAPKTAVFNLLILLFNDNKICEKNTSFDRSDSAVLKEILCIYGYLFFLCNSHMS